MNTLNEKLFNAQENPVFSVSEVNRLIKNQLENKFSEIWLEGEISNLVKHNSGHWYFSLKDEKSQLKAVMFKGFNQKLLFQPKNGMSLRVFGKITVYEPRGDYQILCYKMEPLGLGALQKAFEQLKEKLKSEGLFDETHKKSLPKFPKHIGVISSETGAALQDIINVLKRRSQGQNLSLIPALVQGKEASQSLRKALEQSLSIKNLDVLILARGGGSLEDLWPFNDEALARDIFKHPIPVVSAVGHEIDFSISDFVADLRAPTPSVAAELVTKSREEIKEQLSLLRQNLKGQFKNNLFNFKEKLSSLKKELGHLKPQRIIEEWMQKTDELSKALHKNLKQSLESKKSDFKHIQSLLNSFSPLAVLKRGYSITLLNGKALISSQKVKLKEKLTIKLCKGEIEAEVLSVKS